MKNKPITHPVSFRLTAEEIDRDLAIAKAFQINRNTLYRICREIALEQLEKLASKLTK
jgi:hypothetical protein